MIRTILQTLFLVFIGVLLGQIPAGHSTLGRTAWSETQALGAWSGGQLQSMVSYAGFGDSALSKWLGNFRTSNQPTKAASRPTRREETDPEGLTPSDREAIRQILE